MQPMYRPSLPPQGMRPAGAPPPGAPPPGSLPSGLPPPQRPPAGYRPTFPVGNMPPPGPPGAPPPLNMMGNMSSGSNPMMNPHVNPPIQKMAAMNINPSSTSQQFMSNGVPDSDNLSTQQSFSGSQSNEISGNATLSMTQNNESKTTTESFASTTNTSMSDSLQQRFQQKDSSQDIFPSSQSPSINQAPSSRSPSLNQAPSPSMPDTNFASHVSTQNSNDVSLRSNSPMYVSGTSSSGNSASTSLGTLQNTMPPTSSISNNPVFSPSISQMPSQPRFEPPKPGMTHGSPYLNPPESNISQSSGVPQFNLSPASSQSQSFSSMPPQNSPLGPPRLGMIPQTFQTGPPRPGIPPQSSNLGFTRPGMPPQMGPTRPGMSPLDSHMGTPRPGMSPLDSHMGTPRPGMSPLDSHMGTPRPGMPSLDPRMSTPRPGMSPLDPRMGTPRPGMSPLDPHMGTSRPGMPSMGPPSGVMPPPIRMSPMGPPSGNIPPQHPQQGSFTMSPQSEMHTPRPGMPPPPTNSFMSSPNAGMPPPPIGSQLAPGGPPGMPPTSSSMSSLQAPGVGGMQNRYPGANPAGSQMGGYPQGSQGRRLNPDDMPSPLQVMEEDKQTRSGEFLTNLKGGLPPLVTSDFVVKDGGNASPLFIRSTMYSVPATQEMMKQCSVPFGLVISPLAELHPNEAPIYMGTSLANGPVRCNRCKSYMSPLMMFMDGGRRYQCLLCKQINEVPADYYCHMDSQGARADKYQRPELCLGTYEFVATSEYCKDKLLPKEPAFIFVMEMSQMMVQRGIISLLCQNMKSLLEHLPKDEVPGQEATKSAIRVGFITYDSSVHFYKLSGLAPEMCIVCDKENMFVPVPDGVLCNVEDVSSNIDKLMESIPQNFQTTRENSGALYCAIQAGMEALKASGRAGKLFVFHSSLPQTEGIGKLKNREDRKVLGTDKEKSVLTPQTTNYNNLAQDLVNVGCGVDLFIFNESYVDLATIGQVCRLTGGQSHKYTYFQPNKDAERLLDDLKINISRNIAFESVMRVRTSTGVRPVDFFGHFFMSNTHDIELSIIDSSKAVAVEIKHDDKITEEDGVYIQCALLYTSVGGQRRLRILNLALNICTQMADMYKSCELDTLMNFFGKQSMFKFLDISAKQVKENLIAKSAQILACYRKNCATPSSAGQLILPELMKLLPLYVNSLTKCDALSGGQDLTCDDRSWHIYQLCTMNVEASVVYFYPRLIPLTDIDSQEVEVPPPVRTSYEKLSPDGVYLLENGLFMFMWVGSGTSSSWMKDVFGVSAPHQLDPVLAELPELENSVSKRVRGIIEAVREQRKLHVRLFVVPQQGKHEVVMRNYLVEDKGVFGAPSYVDFLCHVHKEIRALLS